MSSHPKVLFLTSSYPRHRDDTASVFLRYLAENLTKAGIDVHVLAPADGRAGTVVEGRVTVHRFQYFPATLQKLAYGSGMLPNLKRSPSIWLQVPFFLLAMTWESMRLLVRHRFDLVHAHWILPQGLVGLLGQFVFSVPLVVSIHGTDAFALRGPLTRAMKRLILKRSVAWTANTVMTSRAIAHDRSMPAPKVIPMGVDLELFAAGNPVPLRRDLPAGEHVVLFVGRLIENKGCADLLRAFALLSPNRRTRTILWVVGDGDQKTELERTARDLGISEKVRFWGTIDHRQLPDHYAAADLVVVPSRTGSSGEAEGQALVVLEAFAAGACVVASSIGGITALVRNGSTGVLTEPGCPESIARALERLLSEPSLRHRLAATALTETREHYDWSRVASQFSDLYRQAMDAADRREVSPA